MADKNQVAVIEKNISDSVLARVKELESNNQIHFPQNYSYQNALKSAQLILQETVDRDKKPVLLSCSKESIANALFDMVIQGLSPAKKQCYFIAYGGKLQLQRSYFGTTAVMKRLAGVKDVFSNVIYEKDDFAYEIDLDTGTKRIVKHEQSFENIDPAAIKGAYAVIVKQDGTKYVEVMNMKQIRAAWNQGQTKGSSGAHTNFSDQMAMKSVINRAAKMFINTSDDSDLLIEAFQQSDEEERPLLGTAAKEQITHNANAETIGFESEVEDLEPVAQLSMDDDEIPEELR